MWYWIKAEYQGKLIVMGPRRTEEECNQWGYEKLDFPFDVVGLNTRDLSQATRIMKHQELDRTANIDYAIKRAKHKLIQSRQGGDYDRNSSN